MAGIALADLPAICPAIAAASKRPTRVAWPLDKRPGDGTHIGYCTRCGRDAFDGVRHRCPAKMEARNLAVIIAAKQFAEAEREFLASTADSLPRLRRAKIRDERFLALEAALTAHST